MKITLSLLTLLVAITLFATPVSAETTEETATQNQNEYKAEMEAKRKESIESRVTKTQERIQKMETRVTERVEKREDAQEKRQEKRSEIAENHAKRLETNFANYSNRLNNLATKIQTRITLMKEKGQDVSAAQTKLDAAKASLESAKTLGEQAVAAFRAIDPTQYEEQKDQALAARDLANKAREAFRTALKGMKDAVELLVALKVEE